MPAAETDYQVPEPESFAQHVRQSNLARVERRNRIIRLRRMGLTPEQISMALADPEDPDTPPIEMTPSGVRSAIRAYVDELRQEDLENVEVVRQLEVERLDRMHARLEEDVRAKDSKTRHRAIGLQLRVMERRARLSGLDAPTEHRIKGQVDVVAVADPEHVKQIDSEFRGRFDYELPAGDVTEESLDEPEPANA